MDVAGMLLLFSITYTLHQVDTCRYAGGNNDGGPGKDNNVYDKMEAKVMEVERTRMRVQKVSTVEVGNLGRARVGIMETEKMKMMSLKMEVEKGAAMKVKMNME